jgi:hypothetical protein
MSVIAACATLLVGCGGSSSDVGTAPADDDELPTLVEIADVELEDHRPDLLATIGPPDAFRVTFVTVDGIDIRHDVWNYLELETRIDLVEGQIVLTGDLEPLPDGSWYPVHVDPTDFEAGMSSDDVRTRLAGIELEELEIDETPGGSALIGGQLLVTFSDDVIVSAESFPLVPDPDGLQTDLLEAVTP